MTRIKRPFLVSVSSLLFAYFLLMAKADIFLFSVIVISAIVFVITAFKGMAVSKAILTAIAFCVTASILFGIFSSVTDTESELSGFLRKISGTVTEIAYDDDGEIQSAVLSSASIDGQRIYSKIRVYPKENAVFSYGDNISFTAKQTVLVENNSVFRYHTMSRRILFNCYTTKDTVFEIISGNKNLFYSVLSLRDAFSKKLMSALSGNNEDIASALLTGNTDNLSSELTLNLRICGISHIFAVSGMHLSVWTGFFFLILKGKSKVSFIPNLAASLFVIFYIIFTGLSPSVIRAGIMLLCVFTGRIIKRAADALNSLCLAGTVMLLINPYLAGNVSFLLSFIATGAIVLWNDYILEEPESTSQKRSFIRNRAKRTVKNVIISVAVILTTLPVVSVFFGYISLISPIVSLLVTPLAQLVMVLSLAVATVPSGNFVFSLLAVITDISAQLICEITSFFARADFLLLPVKPYFVLPCFIITFVLCSAIILFTKNRRAALMCILSGVLVFTSLTSYEHYKSQDEAALFITGKENATSAAVVYDGVSMVYGAGGTFSAVNELSDFLSSLAVLKLDMLFIPGQYDSETENTDYLISKYLPVNTVHNFSSDKTDKYFYEFSEDFSIYSESGKDFCMTALNISGIKIVLCPLPSSDISLGNEIFYEGDILICRQAIPKGLNTENFRDIIIITDSDRNYGFSYYSTKEKNIEIKVKGETYAIN